MKIINIELKEVKVTKFYPKQAQTELEVAFDDGKIKVFHKTVGLDSSTKLAESIFDEIKAVERSSLAKFNGIRLLEGEMKLVFKERAKIKKTLDILDKKI